MIDDDTELVSRIARGDREAFAALYHRRRPDVYRFALHMSGSASAAEDVVQDVFMAVIHDASRYVPARAAVVPWLLGIARNHVKRWLQRDRKMLSIERATPRDAFMVSYDPLVKIEQRQDVALVRRALMTLPVRYREAIVLCDLRELSYEEAAATLVCALGTVRSRLHRGRLLLAERLRRSESLVRTPVTGLIV